MKTFKGTKEKWIIEDNGQYLEIKRKGNIVGEVCSLFWSSNDSTIPDKEVKANAKLIASAPELLEALINFKKQFNAIQATTEEIKAYHQATEAINKAL